MNSEQRKCRASYHELSLDSKSPPGAAWHVYGSRDELGSINLLTPERVVFAASLVRRGAVFPLNWDLEQPNPALFGRQNLEHSIVDLDPAGTEDFYDRFYPQASSQWDGLAHIRHPEHGFYQGYTRQEITGLEGSRIGIEHWARRGIAGRFVLADLDRHFAKTGQPIRQDESEAISVQDIDACLADQGVALTPGDILLLRFGWINWYQTTDDETRERLASTDLFPTPGLTNSEDTAAWLWDKAVAAVAADNPALEVQPFDEGRPDGFLHYRLIPLLGMAIGELFALDDLASDCAMDGQYDGLFVAAPLNKRGGCGSPANAVAIK